MDVLEQETVGFRRVALRFWSRCFVLRPTSHWGKSPSDIIRLIVQRVDHPVSANILHYLSISLPPQHKSETTLILADGATREVEEN